MNIGIKYELVEIIEKQKQLLGDKDGLICKLLNVNAEQENMINELLKESKHL